MAVGALVAGQAGSATAQQSRLEWEHDVGFTIYSSPTIVDGTVYVGSSDDTLYALDAGVSGSSNGSRVEHRTLGHGEPNPLLQYADDDGIIRAAGLNRTIRDYLGGDLSSSLLNEAIQAYLLGDAPGRR